MAQARTVLSAPRGRDGLRGLAQARAERDHAEAGTLPTPVEHAVQGGAQPLAPRSRKANELVREFVERMAQAKAQARPGKQCPHTLDRAVKAIGESPSH